MISPKNPQKLDFFCKNLSLESGREKERETPLSDTYKFGMGAELILVRSLTPNFTISGLEM